MRKNHIQPLWWSNAASIVGQHWCLKGIGIPLFIGLFLGAYFYLLKIPSYPTTVMPIVWLDSLIEFQPLSLPLYLSLWVYVCLPPTFASTRRELVQYAVAMAMMCMMALTIFYFWPTTVPQANIDWLQYPSVDFLKSLDAAGNACPSLHVATTMLSCNYLHYLLKRFNSPLWVRVVNGMWCSGIIYSTMAIRQHVALDVLAGLALGLTTAAVFSRMLRYEPVMP